MDNIELRKWKIILRFYVFFHPVNDLLEIFNFAIFSLKNNNFLRNFASTEKLLFLKNFAADCRWSFSF